MQLEFTGQNNTDHHMLTLKKKKKTKGWEISFGLGGTCLTLGWEHCLFQRSDGKLIIQGPSE